MAKRLYEYYEVATNGGNGAYESYESYQEAFSVFNGLKKGKSTGTKATLWGVDEMGEFSCIMAF